MLTNFTHSYFWCNTKTTLVLKKIRTANITSWFGFHEVITHFILHITISGGTQKIPLPRKD